MWVITMQHNMMKLATLLLFSLPISYCFGNNDMVIYTNLVQQWRNEISICFNNAEKEVYNITPTPDDDLVRPDEDPAKCPCKGTGVITHGDGHTTPCPFHSKELPIEPEPEPEPKTTEVLKDPPLVKINKVTCECETRCACDDCQCQKTTVDLLLKKTEIK